MTRHLHPLHALRPLTKSTRVSHLTPLSYRLASSSSSFLQSTPSPPRLPADQQAEFERLQRAAEASLSSHNDVPITTTEAQVPLTTSRHVSTPAKTAQAAKAEEDEVSAGSLSAGMRKGAPPEFEGEKNPKTGEVGGPKNEPLRWGSGGDWSYNGRVTDF
ncbi:succinate dehydrogenase assembly factor 4, mitochondrial [Podospora aff. communis PSN243]|uniref:Succinate dehydrogenase assembly factor 4, mitochondrial n=1 Tax=Podospora aff. communis PSN243 TaxID=3040156 RepID=A0AAV9GB66_9PEZI|nr:succinate dehydrogenase assembly factor 4, mitochondrial [Podospora aff. communis PSN243]